jgi:transposase, IS6 family
LGKALKTIRNWPPHSITTDKLGSYPKAIRRLQREGKLPQETNHRTSKYLNNIIEADHGDLKRVIRPIRGFQTMKNSVCRHQGI